MVGTTVQPAAAGRAAAAVRPEVTTVTADAAAAPLEIAAMTTGTLIQIRSGCITMEIRTVRIKPVLTGHMVSTNVAIVTGGGAIAILTFQIMTGRTGR